VTRLTSVEPLSRPHGGQGAPKQCTHCGGRGSQSEVAGMRGHRIHLTTTDGVRASSWPRSWRCSSDGSQRASPDAAHHWRPVRSDSPHCSKLSARANLSRGARADASENGPRATRRSRERVP
jgi:hypothetical protein